MCEHSSVDQAAALRREARRRKILENSTSRLKLIEGINSTVEKPSSDISLKSVPKPDIRATECDEEKEILISDTAKTSMYTKLNDIIKDNKELKEISDFLKRDVKELDEHEDELEDVITEVGSEKDSSFIDVLLEKRLHYVLLALTVNILFFFNAGYLFYENILCPFYTVKAIEILTRRRSNEKEEFQPFLFLFIASLPLHLQKFTKLVLKILIPLFSDLCMYIFIFVIGTKIINTKV